MFHFIYLVYLHLNAGSGQCRKQTCLRCIAEIIDQLEVSVLPSIVELHLLTAIMDDCLNTYRCKKAVFALNWRTANFVQVLNDMMIIFCVLLVNN